jgi:hypothetical protein
VYRTLLLELLVYSSGTRLQEVSAIRKLNQLPLEPRNLSSATDADRIRRGPHVSGVVNSR